MSKDQAVFIATGFVILAVITLAAQFHWLPSGRPKAVMIFMAGVASVVALRIAEMPPAWFAGSSTGFSMAGWFTVASFAGRNVEAKEFGFPLLLGMGLTLGVLNVAAFVLRRL